MKKKLGINIDGVIRDYLSKFENVYIQTFIFNKNLVETNSDMTEIKFLTEDEENEKQELVENLIKKKIKKPFNSFDLLNHFEFEEGVNYLNEIVDAKGKLDEFIELKAFKIFGQAETYKGAVDSFHKLQLIGEENNFDVILLSTLKSKALTATYSFLANNGVRARNISFIEEDYKKWDYCDVLIDVMPESLQTKPKDKISIKIKHEFNEWDNGDYNHNSLQDVIRDKNLIEQIINKLK